MRTRFARRGNGGGPRRGFDWDAAYPLFALTPGGAAFDWLRIPSDNIDPLQDDRDILPKTLIKTLISFGVGTTTVTNGTNGTLYFGIIAWDGRNGDPPANILDTPDPTNGAYDWIIWLPIAFANTSGSSLFYQNTTLNCSESGVISSSAQRKLPPGKGLLWCAFWDSPNGNVQFNGAIRMGLKGDFTAPGLGGG